jgi:hypothetical protein
MYGKTIFGDSLTYTLLMIFLKQFACPLICYRLNKIPPLFGYVYSGNLTKVSYLINMMPPSNH